MNINYIEFTPFSSFFGGIVIGIASILMLIAFGRIAGIAGIIGSFINLPKNDSLWRFSFLFGIISSGFIFSNFINFKYLSNELNSQNIYIIILAGLLVGFGTRLGSGCTSGHGICGISRLSPRSIISTLTFLIVAILTVFVINLI
jgi:uncharacterized membrane protein YedE/YeeE